MNQQLIRIIIVNPYLTNEPKHIKQAVFLPYLIEPGHGVHRPLSLKLFLHTRAVIRVHKFAINLPYSYSTLFISIGTFLADPNDGAVVVAGPTAAAVRDL